MLDYNGDELRVLVNSYYDALSPGLTDAEAITKIFERLMDTASRTLRAAVHEWNRNSLVHLLPDEVLVLCFIPLELCDRIKVSHVSRAWRAVALATPAVWSSITVGWLGIYSNVSLFNALLSRAAQLPLDVEIISDEPDMIRGVVSALERHALQLRSLEWGCRLDVDILRSVAPILESFICHQPFAIPEDFLGRQAGSLRNLHFGQSVRLPRMCAALSTVTQFHVSSLDVAAHAASFESLFKLFPRLQSLKLLKLRRSWAHLLPSSPAPESLVILHLSAELEPYDLMPHYRAWRGENLREVCLTMLSGTPTDLVPIFNGACALSIDTSRISIDEGGWGNISISMSGPDGRKRRVNLSCFGLDMPRAFELVFKSPICLQQVHTVNINATALVILVPLIACLPALQHLGVYLWANHRLREQHEEHHPPHTFSWDILECLSHLAMPRPDQVSLTIDAFCWNSLCPPTAEEACALAAVLASLMNYNLPLVQIRGFSADNLASIDTGVIRTQFDTETVAERFTHFVPNTQYW